MSKRLASKKLWERPWKFRESFLIVLALCISSVILEFATKAEASSLQWPANIVLLGWFVFVSFLIVTFSKSKPYLQWFYSVPASIAAIVFFVVPSLMMALIPQKDTQHFFFLYSATSSWLYYISVAFFLIVLGSVTFKRVFPLSKKNIGFFLNHAGLWCCIACANLGASDIEKYSMVLQEGKTVWYAFDENDNKVELDFALKLDDFTIEEYTAKLAFIDNNSGDILEVNSVPFIMDIDTGKVFEHELATYTVKRILMSSAPVLDRFEPILDIGAVQSVQIEISANDSTKNIWLSTSSIAYPKKMYRVSDSLTLLLLNPDAKKFASHVVVYQKKDSAFHEVIEVNKPIKVNDWKVYQTGYDESMGKWSSESVLEVVRDPWLPATYVGFFLMIAGAFYIIWFGKRKGDK